MNEITCLDYVRESYPNGRKPAKISPEKIKELVKKYDAKWKMLWVKPTVEEATNVVPFPTSQAVVEPVVNAVSETNNVIPFPAVNNLDNSVSKPVVKNYESVVKKFGMTVYENSFITVDLTGARKIRTIEKTKNETKGCSEMMANGKIENIIPFAPKTVVANAVETAPVNNSSVSNVVEFPRAQVSGINNPSSPSVDDYLQKDKIERVVDENSSTTLMEKELESDINSIKKQVDEAKIYLEEVRRKRKIKELEQQRDEYTQVLNEIIKQVQEEEAKLKAS